MGGPWIGQVSWKGQQLPGDYLMQAEVVDPEACYTVLVATNQRTATARSQVLFWLVLVGLGDGLRFTWRALPLAKLNFIRCSTLVNLPRSSTYLLIWPKILSWSTKA